MMPGPIQDTAPTLADQMRAYEGPESDEMKMLANEMDEVTEGYFADPQTVTVQQFVGTWAKTRRRWREVTGAPLV